MTDRPKIIRAWGKADIFDIEFEKGSGDTWCATVPADMNDGQYAVEIYAVNEHNESAYWTGILYMLQGTVCLHIDNPRYSIWMKQQVHDICIMPQNITIAVNRRCVHCV